MTHGLYLGPYLLGPNDENQGIYTGDARELEGTIPDESVDLIFTDPVYQNIDDYRWLAETAARVLKPGGDVLVYLAHIHMDKVLAAMTPHLAYRWLLVEKKLSSGSLMWSLRLYSHYLPLLWFTKGLPRGALSRTDFKWSLPTGSEINHHWAKNRARLEYWLHHYSEPSVLMWEPFCGGGSILEAARRMGRRWLAFEIDPATAERARERVRMTQAPLFTMEPEQAVMEL